MSSNKKIGLYIKESGGEEFLGYEVLIPSPDKKKITKVFTVKKYGSQAIDAAMAWRDAKYLELYGDIVPPAGRSSHKRATKKSSTGVPGVQRSSRTVRIKRGDKVYEYVVDEVRAIHPDGRSRKVFSIKKHGLEAALKMAINERKRMVRDHAGYDE